MNYREVNTITSNDQLVRMRIYEGDLPADKATEELLRIERIQHEATRSLLNLRIDALLNEICELKRAKSG